MGIRYFVAGVVVYVAVLIIVFRLASKGERIQEESYGQLKESLRKRGVLDGFQGPDYERPQWEIRLQELEAFQNYAKIIKHVEHSVRFDELSETELSYIDKITKAARYKMPINIFLSLSAVAFLALLIFD